MTFLRQNGGLFGRQRECIVLGVVGDIASSRLRAQPFPQIPGVDTSRLRQSFAIAAADVAQRPVNPGLVGKMDTRNNRAMSVH